MSVARFERFYRRAAGVGVDKEDIAALPPLDRPLSDRSIARMPEIAGGLSLAPARTFVLVDPQLASPRSRHWEQAFRIFDLLL
jgi:hypothetical protein